MAVNNQRYVSPMDIYAKLSRIHKSKNFSYDDIVEWCAEVETDYIGDVDGMSKFLEVKLDVSGYKAKLPCNVYRILDVYSSPQSTASREPYNNSGAYINFNSTYKNEYIYVDYYGITIDETTGEPLVLKGHEQGCEAYCIRNIYYEDFLLGKITTDRWGYIDNDWKVKAEASKGGFRHWDRQKINDMNVIMGNIIPKIGNLKLAKVEFS